MNILRIALFAVALAVTVLISSCGTEEIRSTWLKSQIVLDGNLDEWQAVKSAVLGDHQASLSVQNDSNTLYLACRIDDEQTRRSIERSGLTIWIDAGMNNRKELEIHFPASRYMAFTETRGGFWKLLSDEQRERAIKRIGEMRNGVLVIDGQSVSSRLFSKDENDSVEIVSSRSNGPLMLEMRVPIHLENLFVQQHQLTGGFSLGIRLDRSPAVETERLPSQFGGVRQMGLGRRGIGGIRPSSSPNELWMKIIMANHE